MPSWLVAWIYCMRTSHLNYLPSWDEMLQSKGLRDVAAVHPLVNSALPKRLPFILPHNGIVTVVALCFSSSPFRCHFIACPAWCLRVPNTTY